MEDFTYINEYPTSLKYLTFESQLRILMLGVSCLVTAIVCSYFFNYEFQTGSPLELLTTLLFGVQEGVPIRVLSLNTWGMPHTLGSMDKEIRIPAIANMVRKKEFDVYLFEELWMRPDHTTVERAAASVGYYMTKYDDLAQKACVQPFIFDFICCDGVIAPGGCSGLAVASRYPMKEIEFTMYNVHGPLNDGEKLARKGFGRVMIEPVANMTIDVFVTHTCASDQVEDKQARMAQVKQLMAAVRKSKADFTVLGGDFNSDPRAINDTTYHILKEDLASSMEDFFQRITNWLIPDRATYANPRNKYSNQYDPVLYDYIWHRSKKGNLVLTNLFDVPWLTTTKSFSSVENQNGDEKMREKRAVVVAPPSEDIINFSDHEAVVASLMLYKKNKV